MKKLLSITLTIAVFCMLSSTALAANWNQNQQQPQDELWQYIQTSDSFWNDIMQQVGISKPENNKPGNIPADKPNETPVIPPSTDNQPDVKPEPTPEPEPTPNPNPDNDNNKPSDQPEQDTNSSYVNQVLQLVNKERAARGLKPLTLDAKASAAAQVRAAECARSFSHTRPDGRSCFTALKEGGVSYRRAGENIAYGQRTPNSVMTDWMNSSGHRANILNSNYNSIGIGYTVINGTPYWAQFFVQK